MISLLTELSSYFTLFLLPMRFDDRKGTKMWERIKIKNIVKKEQKECVITFYS